jgi:hypothetical protein
MIQNVQISVTEFTFIDYKLVAINWFYVGWVGLFWTFKLLATTRWSTFSRYLFIWLFEVLSLYLNSRLVLIQIIQFDNSVFVHSICRLVHGQNLKISVRSAYLLLNAIPSLQLYIGIRESESLTPVNIWAQSSGYRKKDWIRSKDSACACGDVAENFGKVKNFKSQMFIFWSENQRKS